MKKQLLSLVCMLLFQSNYAQSWQWMTCLPGTEESNSGLVKNSNGDLIARQSTVTAYTYDSVSYHSLISSVSGTGAFQWSREFDFKIADLACGDDNVIYVAGYFSDTLVIDGQTIAPSGWTDGILLKLDPSGQYLDHELIATDSVEYCNGVYYRAGKVYITGSYTKPPTIQGETFLTHNSIHLYTCTFDTDLTLISSFQAQTGGPYSESAGIRIRADELGNTFLICNANGYVTFNDSTAHFTESYLIARLDAANSLKWYDGGTYYSAGGIVYQIRQDSQGNVVVVFREGGGGGSSNSMAVAKYNSTGQKIYYKTSLINQITDRAFFDLDDLDNVYVAGSSFTYTYGAFPFAMMRLAPDSTQTHYFFDSDIGHGIKGLVVNGADDLYIYGLNSDTSMLGAHSCPVNGQMFMAHYGTSAMSISEEEILQGFRVFPNPSTSVFIVRLYEKENAAVSIYDILGNCILSQRTVSSSEYMMDLSGYAKGIYFVEVETRGKRYNRKVVLN